MPHIFFHTPILTTLTFTFFFTLPIFSHALNLFQSPIPPQYNPPYYYVDSYTRKESDGWCCQCQASTLSNAVSCLHRCKYAFVKDLISLDMLDKVRENFIKWKPNSKHHNIHFGYRLFAEFMNYGRREYVLPSDQDWVTDSLLLHKPGVLLLKSLAKLENPNVKTLEPLTLEYLTIIDPFFGFFNQWFHSDVRFDEAVNFIYPMVDVVPNMGPFHLDLSNTRDINPNDIVNCPMFFGSTKKGSGIIYKSYAHHRGSVNRSWRDRPALFYMYMYKEHAEEDEYLNEWGYIARKAQSENNNRVVKLSEEDEDL